MATADDSIRFLDPGELLAGLRSRSTAWLDPLRPVVAAVDLEQLAAADRAGIDVPAWLPVVVVGLGATGLFRPPAGDRRPPSPVDLCDLVLDEPGPALERIAATVSQVPRASLAFTQVLRGAGGRSVPEALLVESAVYSALQAGPEFARWRAGNPRRPRPRPPGPVLLADREGSVLSVRLNRPHVRNALDVELRDALLELLDLVAADDTIEQVLLTGEGPAFSSGGDLDDFGTFPDPATAHVVRTATSVGAAIHRVGDRVQVALHGACAGSGVELPAFAGRVIARPGTLLSLPELGLGLIPGAGGTWSLPARIGRHRTAWLGLTGWPIPAETALAWGLVDEIVPAC